MNPFKDYSYELNNSIIANLSDYNDTDISPTSSILESMIFKKDLEETKLTSDNLENLNQNGYLNEPSAPTKEELEIEGMLEQERVYKNMDELREALKKCSKEEIHQHLAFAFEEFSKTDVYKELLAGLKNDFGSIKDYLLHLAIFGWYRDMYIENLPSEKKNDFDNIYDVSNVETKLNKKKGGIEKAIKAYSQEEYNEEFKHLKEVEYVNTNSDGEICKISDNKPFRIIEETEK